MITKIKYTWYEGEEEEHYVVHSTKTIEEFEEDLKQISQKLIDGSTPEFYHKIIKGLEEVGYIIKYCFSCEDYYDISDTYEDFSNLQRVPVISKIELKHNSTKIY